MADRPLTIRPLTIKLARLAFTVRVLVRSGMIALLRPDKYLRMAAVIRREGVTPVTGIGLAAARRPRGLALVDERGELTWAELDRRSNALAVGLAGLVPGDLGTLAILCRNHRGFVESLCAASRVGADALLLNTGFSGPQLTDVLAREGAQLIVYDEEFADLVDQARATVPDLVPVVAWTDATDATDTTDAADTPPTTVDTLIARHRGDRPRRPRRPGRTILLTSGTTGAPKGARRSDSGGPAALAAMLDRIPWRAEQTTVVAAPMFHAWGFGQLAIAATMTCTMVMRRRFDPEATLSLVTTSGATGLAVVPVMLERIMELPAQTLEQHPMSTLRFVTASGSRMRPDSVLGFMDRFGEVVYNSYNATETGLISTAVPADLRAAPETAGRPVEGTELRIVDEEWRDVPRGEVGRIVVRSDSHFEGYTSGDTKELQDSFMVSGDLGRQDRTGRLFVVGRDDDMIVSGGENVYPLEVEQTLDAHPEVREAAVVGVDDADFGQRLAAFVVLTPGATVTPEDLRRHVKEQLAGYKVPRDLTLLEELPRNASGKVMTHSLVDPGTSDTAPDSASDAASDTASDTGQAAG